MRENACILVSKRTHADIELERQKKHRHTDRKTSRQTDKQADTAAYRQTEI